MPYQFDTSLPAYHEAKQSIDFCRQQVFLAIKKLGVCNDREIGDELKWPINRITPRRGELVDKGLIELRYKQKDKITGRTVCYWAQKSIYSQPKLF